MYICVVFLCVKPKTTMTSCSSYGAFHLFPDQHPRLQEGDERGHFPEAVQEVSPPPAARPEGRAAYLKLSGDGTDGDRWKEESKMKCLTEPLEQFRRSVAEIQVSRV